MKDEQLSQEKWQAPGTVFTWCPAPATVKCDPRFIRRSYRVSSLHLNPSAVIRW